MARTPLFGALRRAFNTSGVTFGPRALSRRHFLAMSAAAAAASACAPQGERVAIVGGGVAGLVAAYRLSQAGRPVTLYEASNRLGGRMFTRANFNGDGQFCELGGELVDTGHVALRVLAEELGVRIERLASETDPGADLYQLGGRLYRQSDMVDAAGRGAFTGIAQRIAADQAALLDAEENWTERARALDAMSLRAYLDSLKGAGPDWVIQLLDIAYEGEYGLATSEQSALNLVDFIGVETGNGFELFGESDEAFRIAGGSSSLTTALAERLDRVTRRMQHALVGVARENEALRLTFDGPSEQVTHTHGRVVFALPFSKLRGVDGLESLDLGDAKLRAIREIGYGANAKLMVSAEARSWLDTPAPMTGALYSDQAQLIWETSRGQPGTRGILTNFLTNQHDRDAALAAMRASLAGVAPIAAEALDPSVTAWMDWTRQPFALGSYSSAKTGQYTTLLEETATPSSDGRIQFAGEHTSVDFLGFMNGAVESGERVADALLTA